MHTISAPVMLQDRGVKVSGASVPKVDRSMHLLPSSHTTSCASPSPKQNLIGCTIRRDEWSDCSRVTRPSIDLHGTRRYVNTKLARLFTTVCQSSARQVFFHKQRPRIECPCEAKWFDPDILVHMTGADSFIAGRGKCDSWLLRLTNHVWKDKPCPHQHINKTRGIDHLVKSATQCVPWK